MAQDGRAVGKWASMQGLRGSDDHRRSDAYYAPGGTQVINYSHLFPTRYAIELEGLKGTVASETFKEPSQREDAKKTIKKLLEERYTSGKNKWFFQPLRVRCPSPLLTCVPVVQTR